MDTRCIILAVASPPGRSVRGLIRVSGQDCLQLLAETVRLSASHGPDSGFVRGQYRVEIGGLAAPLPGLLLVFPGDASYTGQPGFELLVPGNPSLADRVCAVLLQSAAGCGLEARYAEPGEFTARAFLHGKIDLVQAEGVAATIAARTDAQLQAARMMAVGGSAACAGHLLDELGTCLALVEAGIDFTDQEDVVPIDAPTLADRVEGAQREIDAQVQAATGTEALEATPLVVMTGPPNAGKSSLFNALLGKRRAVISRGIGTTRDVLVEPLRIQGRSGEVEVLLADMAGEGDCQDTLTREMNRQGERARAGADLEIRCVPPGCETPPPLPDRLIVLTMRDDGIGFDPTSADCLTSAEGGLGIDELRKLIAGRLAGKVVSLSSAVRVLAPRHEACLREASRNLGDVLEGIRMNGGKPGGLQHPEIVASSLRLAVNDLAMLAGDLSPDDVLGKIFSTFCVGK